MTRTVRQAMTPRAQCVAEDETVVAAARRLAELDIGSMPIQDRDGRIRGILTDRDIVVKVVARGQDPSRVSAGSLAQGRPVTVGAEDTLDDAQRLMSRHQVRRLPVIDEYDVVGVISQADIARSMAEEATGDMVRAISHR